jgi:hypothetical protein
MVDYWRLRSLCRANIDGVCIHIKNKEQNAENSCSQELCPFEQDNNT